MHVFFRSRNVYVTTTIKSPVKILFTLLEAIFWVLNKFKRLLHYTFASVNCVVLLCKHYMLCSLGMIDYR